VIGAAAAILFPLAGRSPALAAAFTGMLGWRAAPLRIALARRLRGGPLPDA
jgi:hypothetical protein